MQRVDSQVTVKLITFNTPYYIQYIHIIHTDFVSAINDLHLIRFYLHKSVLINPLHGQSTLLKEKSLYVNLDKHEYVLCLFQMTSLHYLAFLTFNFFFLPIGTSGSLKC